MKNAFKKDVAEVAKEGEVIMKKAGLKTKVNRTFHKAVWNGKKYSPEILMGAGLVGVAATAYLSFKSAGKFKETMDAVDKAKEQAEEMDGLMAEMEDLATKKDSKSLIRAREVKAQFSQIHEEFSPMNKKQLVWAVTKDFAAPVIVGTLSIAAIVLSHNIQYKRIKGLASVLATTVAEATDFRDKVKEKYGQEALDELDEAQITEEAETEDGKKIKVQAVDKTTDKGRWYEDSSEYVSDDHQYNLSRIDSVNQRYLNKYFENGYLVMNDVLEGLGFERTREGALIGWSGEDVFEIQRKIHTVWNPELGDNEDKIYVTWPQPHYVYDEVHFTGRYAE